MSRKKKIYVLQGTQKKGKSATMIYLWHAIAEKYNKTEDDAINLFTDSENYDFVYAIKAVAGHTVGINARGDDWEWIERYLAKLAEENCDIIFCTCHSYGKTEETVNVFAKKHGYEVEFIQKDIEESDSEKRQESMNKTQAEKILAAAGL